jgi:hypothetical protein
VGQKLKPFLKKKNNMATGKCLKLREIKPRKHYPEKAGTLRIFPDGKVYSTNKGRGWKFLYKRERVQEDDSSGIL